MKTIKRRAPELLEEIGYGQKRALKDLVEMTQAKETRFWAKDGKLKSKRTLAANDIRLRARVELNKIHDNYPGEGQDPDKDRAEKCIAYCKTFYEQQDERLKTLYPLPRRKSSLDAQAVYRFELGGGGWLEALPGKNPDKIRSEHPTIVMMDEIAFNDQGAEAYANAISTRPQKLLALSSAKASWFFDMLRTANAIATPALNEA